MTPPKPPWQDGLTEDGLLRMVLRKVAEATDEEDSDKAARQVQTAAARSAREHLRERRIQRAEQLHDEGKPAWRIASIMTEEGYGTYGGHGVAQRSVQRWLAEARNRTG